MNNYRTNNGFYAIVFAAIVGALIVFAVILAFRRDSAEIERTMTRSGMPLDECARALRSHLSGPLPDCELVNPLPELTPAAPAALPQNVDREVSIAGETVRVGATWDELLPLLNRGKRIRHDRVNQDQFEDTRQFPDGSTWAFAFSRTASSPYTLQSVERQPER